MPQQHHTAAESLSFLINLEEEAKEIGTFLSKQLLNFSLFLSCREMSF
jgi:hypothetical protein